MRIKLLTAIIATCFIQGAQANQALPEKSWFNAASISKFKSVDDLAYGIESTYFFAPQTSSGTLDDWGYIDTDSSVSVGYAHHDSTNASYVGGEYFLGQFIAFGSYSDLPGYNPYQVGLGYLVNDNLKLKVNRDRQYGNTDYSYSAQYQHDLADGDYLGFEVTLGDYDSLSTRYFANVNGGDFFTLDVQYNHSDFDVDTIAMAKYYVGQQYAFGVGIVDKKAVLTADYFFTHEYYLSLDYADDNYNLRFVAQF